MIFTFSVMLGTSRCDDNRRLVLGRFNHKGLHQLQSQLHEVLNMPREKRLLP